MRLGVFGDKPVIGAVDPCELNYTLDVPDDEIDKAGGESEWLEAHMTPESHEAYKVCD